MYGGGVLSCRTEGNCIDLAFALSLKMEGEVRSKMQHYIDKANQHKLMFQASGFGAKPLAKSAAGASHSVPPFQARQLVHARSHVS